MIIDNPIREKLEKCISIFPQTGIECISSFAGITVSIKEPWCIMERLTGNYLHSIVIGSGNDQYQAIFGIGFKTNTDFELIPVSSTEEKADAWGEFGNIYCGLLMDQQAFTDAFGVLTQSSPQYESGDVFFPKAWAVYGTLVTPQNLKVYLGYAIRKNTIHENVQY